MKRYLFLLTLLSACQIATAQHYSGINFSPVFLKNRGQNFNWSAKGFTPDRSETTIGYAIGYQGLLFPTKRFSISYGINYVNTYVDHYNDFYFLSSSEPDHYTIGMRTTYKDLEVPLTLRWNFIKEAKFQPYVSMAPVIIVPKKTNQEFILSDYSLQNTPGNYKRGVGFQMDLGAGINYFISKNAVVNLHMSYRRQTRDIYRFSSGLSFLIKF